MIRSLRGRLFVSQLLVVALALAGAAVLAARGYREWLEHHGAEDMAHAAHLAARTLLDSADEFHDDWPAIADSLGHDLDARVTLIAADGTVLGDSEVPRERLGSLENHGRRPEVLAARRTGEGVAMRHSATLGRDLLYVAIAVSGPGPITVLRLAEPITIFTSLSRSLLGQALPAALLALGVGALLALTVTGRHAARIAELERVTMRLADDDRAARAAETPADELGRLGGAINRMAAEGRGRLDALRRERDEREHILAHMSDGVALIDAENRVTRCNHSLASLLDAPRPAEPGTRFAEYARIGELHELVLRARASAAPVECELRLWAPRPRTLHAVATALGAGAADSVLLVLRDLTEGERASHLRQDFVANVSHELRTPLTTIRGYAETLLDGALDDAEHRRGFVDAIRSGATRLEALVTDLLSLADLERSGAAPRLEPLDLRALVEGQVAAFRPAAGRAGLELRLEPGDRVAIEADRARLDQVVANLLDNAIKYTERGGVTVRLGGESATAWCEVSDTGPGIPLEDQPRVFERFYRVDKARSREKGGTGLGLSIVKHVIELHRGDVSLRSAPPDGATFRFVIPRSGLGLGAS